MERNIKSQFGASYKEAEIGRIVNLASDKPLRLESGALISDFPVAFQTHGNLNKDKSNAILICHGLTADQYIIDKHPVTGKPGWWADVVGSGKAIDTDKHFIICPNVLGGCMGSFGPKETNPKTGKPYNLDFPVITIADMVEAQRLLIDYLGIKELFCVIGASMGGMQVLQWASKYPDRIFGAIPIAAAARHTAQNIAFHEVGRQAIMADPDWADGNYLNEKKYPSKGLAVARMTAHVTYLSEAKLQDKFGRKLQGKNGKSYGFDADFRIESYLRHQGITFVDRFDANSYLYITRAMDYFDLAEDHKGVLANAFKSTKASFCLVSFTSDWLFPTIESKMIVHALNAVAANVSFVEIDTDKGHDAFLLDEPEFQATIKGFLEGLRAKRKI